MNNNGLSDQRKKDIAYTICHILEEMVNKVKPLLNPENKASKRIAISFLAQVCSAVCSNKIEELNEKNAFEKLITILNKNSDKTIEQL